MKAEIKTGITRIFGQHCGCTRLLPVRARFLLRGRWRDSLRYTPDTTDSVDFAVPVCEDRAHSSRPAAL